MTCTKTQIMDEDNKNLIRVGSKSIKLFMFMSYVFSSYCSILHLWADSPALSSRASYHYIDGLTYNIE